MKAILIARRPSVFYALSLGFVWCIGWMLASKHYFPGRLSGVLAGVGIIGMWPVAMLCLLFLYRYFASVVLEKDTLLLFGGQRNILPIPLSVVTGATERHLVFLRFVTIEFTAGDSTGRINILPHKNVFTNTGKPLLEQLKELSDKLEDR